MSVLGEISPIRVSEVRHATYVHDQHRPHHRVFAYRWGTAMSGADRVIRWSTAGAVLGVAAVAVVASYEHAYDLVQRTVSLAGRHMVPLTVDGLIYASSMVMLDSARRKRPIPALPDFQLRRLHRGVRSSLVPAREPSATRLGPCSSTSGTPQGADVGICSSSG
jgi:hypothetical protein